MLRLLLLASLTACANLTPAPEVPAPRYAIAIHGGAGSPSRDMSPEHRADLRDGLQHALELAQMKAEAGAPALDIVEAVIRTLEDNPNFNSGRGAVYTAEEAHELDSSIMDGATLACGGVGGVTTVRHPITLARKVMEETRHVLFVADGAEAFADTQDVERVPNTWFDTEDNRKYLHSVLDERAGKTASVVDPDAPASSFGTVGCVVLDTHGNLAAGTSTGGLTAKMFGRIGDSPIIGAGTFADNKTCGVSGTGVGEEYIRNSIARDIAARMEYLGESVTEAAEHAMFEVLEPGVGGVICVSNDGEIALVYNTTGMLRAAADSDGRFEVLIWEDPEELR